MTHQELVEKFKSEAAEIGSLDKEEKELLSMIVDALETRIPKKPYWEHGVWHCKSCGLYIFDDESFCPVCGQAIDWSDGE